MTIHEPATLLTDYVLAAVATVCGWRLHKNLPHRHAAVVWWRITLYATAASAFIAGTDHGFGPDLPALLDKILWISALVFLNFASASMSFSLVHELAPARRHKFWIWLIGLKLAVFVGIEVVHPAYFLAILDYGIVMVAWLCTALIYRRVWRHWAIAAIALTAVSSTVQQSGWDLATNFNHNDLYHVLQAFALICVYRCGRLFGQAVA